MISINQSCIIIIIPITLHILLLQMILQKNMHKVTTVVVIHS